MLDPCRKLAGTVLDPQGNPLTGARIYGLFRFGFWTYWPQTSADFTVSGLTPPKPLTLARLVKVRTVDSLAALVTPEKPRTLVFQHDGKRLAGFTDVFRETKGPVQVRLQPWGVITGRLVDADGHPPPALRCCRRSSARCGPGGRRDRSLACPLDDRSRRPVPGRGHCSWIALLADARECRWPIDRKRTECGATEAW